MSAQEPFDIEEAVEAAERSGMSPEALLEKWAAKTRALTEHASELEKFMEMRPQLMKERQAKKPANENGTNS